jgi:hypothetical protein
MSIEYTYEIILVDAQARCMEIVYNAAGHPTMHIGARLPYEGETLEDVIRMYAPVRYWEERLQPVVVPEVGASGSLAPLPPAPVEAIPPTDVIDVRITDL